MRSKGYRRLIIIALLLLLVPVVTSAAGTVLSPPVSITQHTGPVLTVTDTGAGAAIVGSVGTTAGAVGIFGKSTNTTNRAIGIMGEVSGPSSTGVIGETFSADTNHSSIGVEGISRSGFGVFAESHTGAAPSLFARNIGNVSAGPAVGIQGLSAQGTGVIGQTENTLPQQGLGVLGQDLSTPGPGVVDRNFGVEGTSWTGVGVVGISNPDDANPFGGSPSLPWVGVKGVSEGTTGELGVTLSVGNCTTVACPEGDGVFGTGFTGIEARGEGIFDMPISHPAVGLIATGDTGIVAHAFNTIGGSYCNPGFPCQFSLPAIYAQQDDQSQPIMIANNMTKDVMSLDVNGNLIISGRLTQTGTPLSVSKTSTGTRVFTYSTQQSLPSIEDFGEATLINGQAIVRLDPAFAAPIDKTRSYLVFITPQGDAGSLYVSDKSATGSP